MPAAECDRFRVQPVAGAGDGLGTAIVKGATAWAVQQVGHAAGDDLKAPPGCSAMARIGAQQGAGIGVARIVEHLCHWPALDDEAEIHHHDLIRHFGDDAEVVGDEQDAHAGIGPEFAHEVEDLRLGSHIQCRGRFVGDQQWRAADQRHGNHRPLAHAARELEAVGIQPLRRLRQADPSQHLDRAFPYLLARHVLVQVDRLGHLVADGVYRREGGHRLLEDHTDVAAADVAHLLAVGIEPGHVDFHAVPAAQHDFATSHP